MRLIRLTTKNLQGYFDCDFNQDVILEPNSKIALHSFTSQFNRFELVINAQNDKIKFSVDDDGAIKIISLPNGSWNNSNIQDFQVLATTIFNKSMEYTRNQLGRQWYVGTESERFTIQCMAGTIINAGVASTNPITKFIKTVNVSLNSEYGTGAYQRSGGTTSQNDAFMYFTSTQCKGSASFRAKYRFDIEPENSGFILAYRKYPTSAETTLIEQNTITYGIRLLYSTAVGNVGLRYSIIVNGIETVIAGVLPVLNDTLAIDTYGGNIYLRIYRDAGNAVQTLYISGYDHLTNYFPVAVFVGDTVMNTIRFTTDYFYNRDNPPSEIDNTLGANNNLPVLGTIPATNNFLEFDDPLLSQELGYRQYRYPLTGYNTVVNAIYTGENGFKLRDFSESYIIEMLNLNIESFDSLSKQHRNFLAVIPQVSQVREQVVYNTPQLIWLDINNAFPLIMRQFKARVLREDLTPISTYGLSQIVVIVKGENE